MGCSQKNGSLKDAPGLVNEISRYEGPTEDCPSLYSSLVAYKKKQRPSVVYRKTKPVLKAVKKSRKTVEELDADTVVSQFQKLGKMLKKDAKSKVKEPVKKQLNPFTKAVSKIADTVKRGIPVHVDSETLRSIDASLKQAQEHLARDQFRVTLDPQTLNVFDAALRRIEERLARIEEKGIAVAGVAGYAAAPVAAQPMSSPDAFKEKPDKKKSMLLRAIMEDTKRILES